MNARDKATSRIVRKWLFGPVALSVFAACSHKPPPDFAPDPGLLAHIREIQIKTTAAAACPGAGIAASYDAVLDDATHVPFQHTYDKKHPPRLHMVFLDLSSSMARANSDGYWVMAQDPLLSAASGFELHAYLKAKPSIQGSVTVAPDYGCAPHAFGYAGEQGGASQAGGNGPDVTVRIGRGRSPFYDRLIIVGVQVGMQAPFYELYDGRSVPPADFVIIESRGGRGGAGGPGPKGGDGSPGAAGCPAQNGGPGGDGGNGGPGAPGGRGGPITIIVPADDPYMAGLVTARSPGGPGGPGGVGGPGGAGGKGGQGGVGGGARRWADGQDGAVGRKGQVGATGSEGPRGPQNQIVTLPGNQVFGPQIPAELAALLGQARRR